MKKVFVLLLTVVGPFVFHLKSQPQTLPPGVFVEQSKIVKPPHNQSRLIDDTIYTPYVAALVIEQPIGSCTDVDLFADQNGGYVFGNNSRGDKEKMQKYPTPSGYGMYQTLIYVMYKTMANPDSNLYSTIYTVDPITHGPGDTIFTSDPTTMSNVTTDMGEFWTAFNFPIAIPIPDSFFVSFSLPRWDGDTIGVGATQNGCYPDQQVAWERRSNNTFHPINDGTSTSWLINTEIFMAPVLVQIESNGDQLPLSYNGITIIETFPNPADERLNIKFELEESSEVELQIVDLSGKILLRKDYGIMRQGQNELVADVSALPAGVYNYGVRYHCQFVFSRFTKI
jgi:hypothetical protein